MHGYGKLETDISACYDYDYVAAVTITTAFQLPFARAALHVSHIETMEFGSTMSLSSTRDLVFRQRTTSFSAEY